MSTSATDLLTSVNSAILALTDGGLSSYTVNGQSFTKLELGKLMAWRRSLQDEIAGDSDGNSLQRVGFGVVH